MFNMGLSDECIFILNHLVSVDESILFSCVYVRYVRELEEAEHLNAKSRKRHLYLMRENLFRQIKVVSDNDVSSYSDDEKKAVGMLCDGARSLLNRIGNKIRAIEDLSYLNSSRSGRKKADSGMKIDSLKADGRVIDSLKHLVDKVHKNGNSYEYSNIICALKMKDSPLCLNSKKDIAHAIKNYLNDDSLNVETMCSRHNTSEHKIARIYQHISDKLKKTDK